MANTEISNCGEDRNLLRIREQERRNQEIRQEKESFLDSLPLFGEPYKTTGDELSSRIQSMLGNYEEVKDYISHKSHQDFVGIPKNAAPLTHLGKADHPHFADKSSSMMQKSWHTASNKHMGAPVSMPSQVILSGQFHKPQYVTEQPSNMQSTKIFISHNQRPLDNHHSKNENYSSHHPERNDGHGHVGTCDKLSSPHCHPSPFPSLSPPVEPLSPLQSNQHSDIKSQNSSNHERAASQTRPSHITDVLVCKPNRESSGCLPGLTLSNQSSTQTFPSSLPSKNSKVQQKPTAYVRPMDGQDQMPSNSPELKPTPEHYTEDSYENASDVKAITRPSKLKAASKFIQDYGTQGS
ncbi:AF4/FMR2 family member 1-like [Protopterus annectens]|uniref:AF4/FMR2 family member 1-like n=1 Tax=Protopterus annectens TaxID=7888 RepID=UPI001CFABE65|nr:AF4/FMR2 family member 1-like [Protopterus annectens]